MLCKVADPYHHQRPRKGSLASLLRFQCESTVTSDGIAQKLGNNILHDFELTSKSKFAAKQAATENL